MRPREIEIVINNNKQTLFVIILIIQKSCKNIAQNYHILYTQIPQLLICHICFILFPLLPSQSIFFLEHLREHDRYDVPMPLNDFCLYTLKKQGHNNSAVLKNEETNFDTSLNFSNFELVQLLMYPFLECLYLLV